ncbi:helix-turn-helix transcriptional regulator [Allonocardiopsis opalescens]|uniref:AraC-like DNA-binding protein n=1 Tax=Allonocardiopsis opalescens TaxID=1144618 RepID=A0A2T0QAJ6_9ACTN|nr:AraC family transcriptional regulator [Allonocardiopsis opalescens]PRY00867.1 AraC-like DNA-binding protein [Allonocardiopsis opalescens]
MTHHSPVASAPLRTAEDPAPEPLLTTHHRLSSTSVDDLHAAVEPLAVGHDLHALDPSVGLDGVVNGLTLERVRLVWVRYGGGGAVVETPPTEGEFALCVPQGEMGVSYLGSGRSEVTGGTVLVSDEERMRMTPDPVAGCLVVSTSMGRLQDHLQSLTGRPMAQPLRFFGDDESAVHGPALVDQTWRYTVTVLDQVAVEGVHPMAARSLEQSLLSALLLGLPHTATAELAGGLRTERIEPGLAARVVEWLEANYDRPLGVADIAEGVGVSVRYLQFVCRRSHGLTPMQLLRNVRLDRARAALLRAEPTRGSVSAIAIQTGFAHLARFAAAYRQRFGETPSTTLREAHGPAAAKSALPRTP